MKFTTTHKIHNVTVNIDISFRLNDFRFVHWKACHSSSCENEFLLHRSRKWTLQICSTIFKRRNAGRYYNFPVFLKPYDIMSKSFLWSMSLEKKRLLIIARVSNYSEVWELLEKTDFWNLSELQRLIKSKAWLSNNKLVSVTEYIQ